MKILVILFFLAGLSAMAQAQVLGGFLDQKATQLKYLAEQIAAYEVYITDLQKGYKVVQQGLSSIHDITNGEFNLHSQFFNSLESINPAIKNSVQIAGIIAFQASIITQFQKAIQTCSANNSYNPSELAYIGKVYSSLLSECNADISELLSVVTANQLQMTDDQRVARIDKLYFDMQDKSAFTSAFTTQAMLLGTQRQMDIHDAGTISQLQGIN